MIVLLYLFGGVPNGIYNSYVCVSPGIYVYISDICYVIFIVITEFYWSTRLPRATESHILALHFWFNCLEFAFMLSRMCCVPLFFLYRVSVCVCVCVCSICLRSGLFIFFQFLPRCLPSQSMLTMCSALRVCVCLYCSLFQHAMSYFASCCCCVFFQSFGYLLLLLFSHSDALCPYILIPHSTGMRCSAHACSILFGVLRRSITPQYKMPSTYTQTKSYTFYSVSERSRYECRVMYITTHVYFNTRTQAAINQLKPI